MTIHLDHTILPTRNKIASAKLLAQLLGVPWAASGAGPFAPVYVNDGLTLDFLDTDEAFPVYHFCFRVSPQDFDAQYDNVYWNKPDGHQWEMLTVSYARQAG